MSLRRGDLVTVAAKGPYTGKPRSALIVQADRLAGLGSVMVCAARRRDIALRTRRSAIFEEVLPG